MDVAAVLLLLTGMIPLVRALRANRNTTLRSPLWWALLAWLAWATAAWSRVLRPDTEPQIIVYTALCLTSCAGIAVLGARRPGASAWNFVVLGLLAVVLMPILNGLGELRLEAAQELFLAVMLIVPFLNYLPTRMGPSIALAAAGCGWELVRLIGWTAGMSWLGLFLLSLSPWTAWVAVVNRRQNESKFDQLWRAYRDRFGFVWGQRMREQFNRAAHHAGWPVLLNWSGLHRAANHPSPDSTQLVALLRAVLKRFGPEEEDHSEKTAHG